ncbi:DUF4190 domain-containing protein [Weissella cibaria]|uniref:DUF4190 domain-containing protein n=2 Tax=Weissella cibaria TaxID=137591 RepID=UPI00189F81D4|nr:DUF4190 domain-containing protein [Weissella cibaria]
MEKTNEKKLVGIIALVFAILGLVLSWVPIVNNIAAVFAVIGIILGVIALIINRKNKKTIALVSTILAIVSIIIVLVTQSIYSHAVDTVRTSTSTASSSTKSSSSLSSETDKNTIEVNYTDYDVKDSKTYTVNYTDNTWSAANVKINSVTVYKLAKAYTYDSANDGKFNVNGFVRLNVSVSPSRDVQMFPTQGTLVLDNGEQHEADSTESWDGDISSGATKTGDITIPVSDLAAANSINNLRFKFDSFYDTDDYDDDNSNHDYDMSFNLNN